MKKYDKIWVPEKRQGMAFRDLEGDMPSILSGPVIVLTIEEAKEMWVRAVELFYGMDVPNIYETTSEDFKTYLKSKGIEL